LSGLQQALALLAVVPTATSTQSFEALKSFSVLRWSEPPASHACRATPGAQR
jgi:hypothetical protein